MAKSQITLFIIIGLVILAVVGIAMFYMVRTTEKDSDNKERINRQIEDQMQTFEEYVQTCIDESFTEALSWIGSRGGYDQVPLELLIKDTRYWYYMGVDESPTLNTVKLNLQDYIDQRIARDCTDHTLYRSWGYEVQSGVPESQILIADSYIFLNVDYPLTIRKDSYVKQFSKFKVTKSVRLKRMYEIADSISKQAETIDRYIPPEVQDFDIRFNNFYEGLIVTVKEKSTSTFDKDFELRFGLGLPISYDPVNLDLQKGFNQDITIPSGDYGVFLKVPSGIKAFLNGTEVTNVSIKVNPPENLTSPEKVLMDMYYDIKPEGVIFDKNLTLALYYKSSAALNATQGLGAPLPVTVNPDNGTIEFKV